MENIEKLREMSFFDALELSLNIAKSRNDVEMVKLLLQISGFVELGGYSKRKHADVYSANYYQDTATLVEILGVTSSRVRGLKSLLSAELYEIFGDEIFVKAYEGDKVYVKMAISFAKSEIDLESVFLTDLVEKLETIDEDYDGYLTIADCFREIEFLATYSKQGLEKALDGVSLHKLKHLANILNKGTDLKAKKEFKDLFDFYLDGYEGEK